MSNRLLGNRQAFLNNTNQAVNVENDSGKLRNSVMTKTTATTELLQTIGPDGKLINIENPNADLQLTEMELAEIFARPQMDPNHGVLGNRPDSNKLLTDEMLLIDAKREKLIELIRQSTEIHEQLDKTRSDPDILAINDNRGVDLSQIVGALFNDQHFNNSKSHAH